MRRLSIALLAALALCAAGTFDRALAQPASASPASTSAASAASASPAAATTAPASVPEDPAVTVRAKDWFARLQRSDLDRSQLRPAVSDALTDVKAKELAAQIAPLGTPASFAYVSTQKTDEFLIYIYTLTFKDGSKFEYTFSLDPQGKIGGLFFKPL